jgi:uncharacterized protein (TIGR00251 family)
MPSWLKEAPDHLILSLHVQPGAKRTGVVGTHGDALKIRLAAPPVDGRANEELIAFLAREFGVPKRQVELVSGATGRNKRVIVHAPVIRADRDWV